MSYEDAFGPYEAHHKSIVVHQTFGHLFPDNKYYIGKVRIATSLYENGGVLDESRTLPCSSPWWFDAIHKFADQAHENMKCGEVAEFDIKVEIVHYLEELEQWQIDEEEVPEEWDEIHITELTKTILVEAL